MNIPVPSPPFRQGTVISQTPVALIYNAGGIGDYIHWTTAIRYVVENHPHIRGHIITPPYFADLAHLWLGKYAPRFEVREEAVSDYDQLDYIKGSALIIPNDHQYMNASSWHLFSLGFAYYAQIDHVPEGYETLPEINGDEADTSSFNLPEKYAVVTTEATVENRKLSAVTINTVIDYLLSEGITPVFLGKRDMAPDHKATGVSGVAYYKGLDLREKTSLTGAACIMAKAVLVVGLDNGLLHLASCSLVPVVWIFTTVDPRLRVPPRRPGAKNGVIVPPKSLACRFCNTNMRYVIGHAFKDCLYKDNLCISSIPNGDIITMLEKIIHPKESHAD